VAVEFKQDDADSLKKVLKEIDKRNVASLIQVIDRLAKTNITLDVVRPHLLQVIERDTKYLIEVTLTYKSRRNTLNLISKRQSSCAKMRKRYNDQ
jgi:hypothetical protein